MGILRIRDLNKGMALKQGDKTTLKFELYDANDDPLVLSSAGKVYFKQKGQIYAEEDVTITTENVVSFKLNTILPAGKYYIEFVVDDKVFPSQDIDTFHITSSVLGDDISVIAINGIDRVAERALVLIEDDLQAIEEAELTRAQSELDRQAQEEARETAEGERKEAEVQRKADHANRSAEFDGKADKVVIQNSTENGDFRDGMTRWRANGGGPAIVEGNYTITGTGAASVPNVQSVFTLETKAEEKWYIHAVAKPLNVNERIKLYIYQSSSLPSVVIDEVPKAPINTWHTLSGVRDIPANMTAPYVFVSHNYPTAQDSFGKKLEIDSVTAINLTKCFGKGNEPTKEEMDEIIKFTGYIDDEYVFNNREILDYLMKVIREKANKKQEEWITPTLLNGWVEQSPSLRPQYMKDEFGFVHFKGCITGGTDPEIFSLPDGYRTLYSRRFPVTSGDNSIKTVTVYDSSAQIRGTAGDYAYLDNVVYEAER